MSNTVSDFTTAVFASVDAMDADTVASHFAPDGTLRFGNHEPLIGPDAIRAANAAFFELIRGIHHHVVREWVVGQDTIIELSVTYDRLDGAAVTIPVVSIWTRGSDGLFTSYRIFYDTAPVFA